MWFNLAHQLSRECYKTHKVRSLTRTADLVVGRSRYGKGFPSRFISVIGWLLMIFASPL